MAAGAARSRSRAIRWQPSLTASTGQGIDAGETPLPLKIVVTDTTEPSEPQQTFLFTDWDLAADLPDSMFTPDIPEDSALAAFLPKKGN